MVTTTYSPPQVDKKYIAIVDGDISETFERTRNDPTLLHSFEVTSPEAETSESVDFQTKKMKLDTANNPLRGHITAPIYGRYEERPKQVRASVAWS
jgi:hypothetical protein